MPEAAGGTLMSEDKLKAILARARNEVEQDVIAKEEAKRRVVDLWQRRADILKDVVLPRLQAAKEAWKDTVELNIHEQTAYNASLPDRSPLISFHLGKFNPNNPGIGGSLIYVFTITESGAFHIYEGETVKNSLDLRVGLKGESLDDTIIDNVLEIAAKDYFRRNS